MSMPMTETEGEFEEYLRSALQEEVAAHETRLEGLEERVLDHLSERLLRHGPLARLREVLTPLARKPAWAFALTATVFLVAGIFLGFALSGPALGTGNGVLFVVAYPEAHSVTVAGDFNNWTDTPLHRTKDGLWVLKLNLPPGRYEYAFKIDGKKWVPDPRADEYVKTYGGQYNSVIYV